LTAGWYGKFYHVSANRLSIYKSTEIFYKNLLVIEKKAIETLKRRNSEI
jgi:hypothetical protein